MHTHTTQTDQIFFFKVSICLQINESIIKDKVRENQGKSEDMVLHNTASCGYSFYILRFAMLLRARLTERHAHTVLQSNKSAK